MASFLAVGTLPASAGMHNDDNRGVCFLNDAVGSLQLITLVDKLLMIRTRFSPPDQCRRFTASPGPILRRFGRTLRSFTRGSAYAAPGAAPPNMPAAPATRGPGIRMLCMFYETDERGPEGLGSPLWTTLHAMMDDTHACPRFGVVSESRTTITVRPSTNHSLK